MVRAKFVVDSVTKTKYGFTTIIATPVIGGKETENQKFLESTPSGKLELQVKDAATSAAAYFKIGAEYYADFHEVGELVVPPEQQAVPTPAI